MVHIRNDRRLVKPTLTVIDTRATGTNLRPALHRITDMPFDNL
jgi:hypothetical protein